jgi:hypothetical protein
MNEFMDVINVMKRNVKTTGRKLGKMAGIFGGITT